MTYTQSYVVRGKRGSIVELCRHFGEVESDRALKRIRDGWSIEDAVCKPLGQKRGRKAKQALPQETPVE